MNSIQRISAALLTTFRQKALVVAALATVAVGAGYAVKSNLDADCCHPGAACCKPGAACCKGHAGHT